MPMNVDDIIRKLSPAKRKKVEARAAQLIAEEMTLSELRKAMKRTQKVLGERMNVNQPAISKIESRTDIYVSTLREFVEAKERKIKRRKERRREIKKENTDLKKERNHRFKCKDHHHHQFGFLHG